MKRKNVRIWRPNENQRKNEKGVLSYNTTHSSLYTLYNAYKFFWINKIVHNVKHPPAYLLLLDLYIENVIYYKVGNIVLLILIITEFHLCIKKKNGLKIVFNFFFCLKTELNCTIVQVSLCVCTVYMYIFYKKLWIIHIVRSARWFYVMYYIE